MRSMRCSRGTELYFVVYMRHHWRIFCGTGPLTETYSALSMVPMSCAAVSPYPLVK